MKLGMVYTGGTIGCFYKPLRPMTSQEFALLFDAQALPILNQRFTSLTIEYLPFGPPALDSTNLQPKDWGDIVNIILPRYADFDAFLILHGTDTMAYSASALSFLFTGLNSDGHRDAILNKPVILTGSQVPLFDGTETSKAIMRFNTDAFQNVCGAVECAHYGIPKVCLFFHNKLFLGCRTQKTSSNQFDAFSSPNYPPLAVVGIKTTLNHGKIRSNYKSSTVLLTSPEAQGRLREQLDYIVAFGRVRVSVIEAYPGSSTHLAEQIEALLHLGDSERQLHGLILEAYGAGNFPSGNPESPKDGCVYKILQRASQAGVIIINNTTCLNGIVDSGAYAAGSWLASINAISAYDMTAVALYTKLLYILALRKRFNWDSITVRRLMTTNFSEEMMDVHCLDTFGQRELWPGESITSRDGTAQLTNNLFRGPQLVLQNVETGEWDDEPVWSAVSEDQEVGLTCILRMQTDGNLVFRDNTLKVLWDSGTGRDHREEPFSRLELRGRTDGRHGASLSVYNYVSHVETRRLYPPPSQLST